MTEPRGKVSKPSSLVEATAHCDERRLTKAHVRSTPVLV